MDYETKKEIDRLKARITELETRLLKSTMPEAAVGLIEDLEMELDNEEDEQVTLELIEEFIKDIGYDTRKYQEISAIIFTDMFWDYELRLANDCSIKLSLCVEIDPDTDRNMLYLISATGDMSAEIRFDWERDLIEFSVHSVRLTKDTYRQSIRFFINLLNESEFKLFSCYNKVRNEKIRSVMNVKYS